MSLSRFLGSGLLVTALVVTGATAALAANDADLSITESGPTSVNRGNSPHYTFTVYNGGSSLATNVVVTDPIPSGLTFLPSLSSSGCVQNGSVVECSLGTISAYGNKAVEVVFDTGTNLACGASYVNRGTASTSAYDQNSTNNTAALTTTITCGHSSATTGCIEINSTTYDLSGNELSNPGYTVSLSNGARLTTDRGGYGRFSDVPTGTYSVSMSVPSNYYVDTKSPTDGSVYVDGNGCERVYFRVVSRTNNRYANVSQCDDGIDNDGDRRYDYPGDPGCSSYNDDSEYDNSNYNNTTYYNNNGRPVTTYYNDNYYNNNQPYYSYYDNGSTRRGGITLDKRVDRLEVLPGGSASYTITIRNNTSSNIRDVEIEDRYDVGNMRVLTVTEGGAIGGGRIRWNLGSVPANGSRTVRVRMQVDPSLPQGSMLTNTATARGSFGSISDSVSVRVVSSLPQTGFDLDSLFGTKQQTAALPIAVSVVLGLAGLASGGVFGRRFI